VGGLISNSASGNPIVPRGRMFAMMNYGQRGTVPVRQSGAAIVPRPTKSHPQFQTYVGFPTLEENAEGVIVGGGCFVAVQGDFSKLTAAGYMHSISKDGFKIFGYQSDKPIELVTKMEITLLPISAKAFAKGRVEIKRDFPVVEGHSCHAAIWMLANGYRGHYPFLITGDVVLQNGIPYLQSLPPDIFARKHTYTLRKGIPLVANDPQAEIRVTELKSALNPTRPTPISMKKVRSISRMRGPMHAMMTMEELRHYHAFQTLELRKEHLRQHQELLDFQIALWVRAGNPYPYGSMYQQQIDWLEARLYDGLSTETVDIELDPNALDVSTDDSNLAILADASLFKNYFENDSLPPKKRRRVDSLQEPEVPLAHIENWLTCQFGKKDCPCVKHTDFQQELAKDAADFADQFLEIACS